jgi:hypothetical protein
MNFGAPGPGFFSMDPATAAGPGKKYFIVTEDQLRQMVIDFSQDIHRDTERMSDMIREMVNTDRAKAGLDNPEGIIELTLHKKQKDSDPDMTGSGRVAGRQFRAFAWLGKTGKLKVSLLPAKRP